MHLALGLQQDVAEGSAGSSLVHARRKGHSDNGCGEGRVLAVGAQAARGQVVHAPPKHLAQVAQGAASDLCRVGARGNASHKQLALDLSATAATATTATATATATTLYLHAILPSRAPAATQAAATPTAPPTPTTPTLYKASTATPTWGAGVEEASTHRCSRRSIMLGSWGHKGAATKDRGTDWPHV